MQSHLRSSQSFSFKRSFCLLLCECGVSPGLSVFEQHRERERDQRDRETKEKPPKKKKKHDQLKSKKVYYYKKGQVVCQMSGNHDVNAFEWLAGGLFFGGGGNNQSNATSNNNNTTTTSNTTNRRELQSIEKSKDVELLWNGVRQNFEQIMLEQQQQAEEEEEEQKRLEQQQQQQIQNQQESTTTASSSSSEITPATAAATTAAVVMAPPPTSSTTIETATTTTTTNTTATTTNTTTTSTGGGGGSSSSSSSNSSSSTVADYLSARLSRLRFLLYEERKLTSTCNFRLNWTPSVAVATVQFFAKTPPPLPLPPLSSSQQQQEQQSKRQQASLQQVQQDSSTTTTTTTTTTACPAAVLWPEWINPRYFQRIPFESRKVLTHLFCYLLVSGLDDGPDSFLYRDVVMTTFVHQVVVPQLTTLLTQVMAGYQCDEAKDIALHCGSIYRSLLRHGILYHALVGTTMSVTQFVFPFLDTLVHTPNFDVASDAMETLRLVLAPNHGPVNNNHNNHNATTNTIASTNASSSSSAAVAASSSSSTYASPEQMNEWAAEFMTRDYQALWDDRFVPHLLFANEHPNNYMTKRGALQILSTILLTRTNYNVMVRFVASARNLKVILLLLRHTSSHITLDAFHVFKVFVANPHKPQDVIKILKDNQVKLCAYLKTLHADKAHVDAQFRDERALIIATIEAL